MDEVSILKGFQIEGRVRVVRNPIHVKWSPPSLG